MSEQHSDRRTRLARLIAGRAAISSLLLGCGVLIELNQPGTLPVNAFYSLIGLTFFLAAVWAALLPRADRWPWQADVQIALDTLVVSAFIVVTGGAGSYFILLYALPILAAASVMRRRGAIAVAALSSALYVALVALQYQGGFDRAIGWIAAPAQLPPARVAVYMVGMHVVAFLAVGALAGSLAERLRRAGASLENASTQIANLQAFNRDIIESLTSGLVTTDHAGRILSFNHAAEIITGQPAQSAPGRDATDLLRLPEKLREVFAHGLEAAPGRREDFLYQAADGRTVEIGMAVTHLVTPGGKLGFLFTFQDITEVKRLERDARLRQRLAAVGEMAAGISHEIRNPLASMAGSLQVLRQELTLDDDQAHLMDIVLRESQRLNDTIRNFLSYARPQQPTIARIDLGQVVADTARLLSHSSEVQASHSVVADVPDAPVWFDADEGQVRQILLNLATNGLRAMPDGGRLRLAVAGGDPSAWDGAAAPGATIEVEDQGVGIPPEEIDGIFQPFHGTFARGSGLGLAIVHRIVTDNGGTIEVTSAVGHGTLIRVRLGTEAAEVASG
jgi:two-component system sensor histidine kinase PilS (NtrC family)